MSISSEKMVVEKKLLETPPSIKSGESTHVFSHGMKIIVNAGIGIASIPDAVKDVKFLDDNPNDTYIVSAKNALDANNEPLQSGFYKIGKHSRRITSSTLKNVIKLSPNEKIFF